MIVTLEISMYPLREDYQEQVLNFLDILSKNSDLEIRVNALSTQVQGEHSKLMDALNAAIKEVYANGIKASFVMKLLPGEIDLDYKY